MNNLTLGILAHVDAGKTTLTEDLLYLAGVTRKIGRVDHGDAFLDTDKLEKERGITIFSKEAAFDYQGIHFNLIDTPGHVDFSGEMERALSVLDAAIIVISALDGATAHTKTVFRLLSERAVPTFLFINKMDQAGADRAWVLNNLKNNLSEDCVTLDELETIAPTEEAAMDEYLESGELKNATLSRLIKNRHIFPCFFGSALKNEGVKEFLDSFCELASYPGFLPTYPADFGARVYNISRDEKGVRLTHVKITGGRIAVKDDVCGFACESPEKINQIRVYSGRSFEQVGSVSAGDVCTFVGPAGTFPGQGLGFEEDLNESKLSPVLSYHIILPEGCVPQTVLPKLLELGDEDPLLNMRWDEELGTVSVMLMGEVQADVLKSMIRDRVGIDVSFSDGEILYKETIAAPVEGVGHYEPLRHYAEVHLLLEPAEAGSGISLGSDVSTDDLALNWQRLIFTHLSGRDFQGVLTGSALTDVRITLVAGRDHIKHTEGGDFRESTYRAVRQGLMEAESVLLEPYFDFTLELPPANVGRALNDLNNMSASFEISESDSPLTVILGTCPAITICNYQSKVLEYTRGQGRLSLENAGYKPCHNAEEVISRISYDPDSDKENPSGSIFCSHGAGVFIPWDKVKDKCHLACIKDIDKYLYGDAPDEAELDSAQNKNAKTSGTSDLKKFMVSGEEAEAILLKATHANSQGSSRKSWHGRRGADNRRTPRVDSDYVYKERPKKVQKDKYLLVDGYNLIFAWPELKSLMMSNADSARDSLNDILCKYQSIRHINLIVVYDAYRVAGHNENYFDFNNIHVVFTKEAETADRYIERFSHEHGKTYDITVVTSDALEQIITLGAGCTIMSSREFIRESELANEELRGFLK